MSVFFIVVFLKAWRFLFLTKYFSIEFISYKKEIPPFVYYLSVDTCPTLHQTPMWLFCLFFFFSSCFRENIEYVFFFLISISSFSYLLLSFEIIISVVVTIALRLKNFTIFFISFSFWYVMVILLFPMSLKKHPPLFRDHKSSKIYRAPRHNADICVGDACLHLAFLAIYILRITIDFNKACNLLFSMRRKMATKLQIMTFQLLQHALMHLYPHSFASDETYYGLPRTVSCSIWKRKIS